MDLMEGYMRAQDARSRGAVPKRFDFAKAAQIIKERGAQEARAGLYEDWSMTSGMIFDDGKPVLDHGAYLSSIWATPVLVIDGDEFECWLQDGKDTTHEWPEEVLCVL